MVNNRPSAPPRKLGAQALPQGLLQQLRHQLQPSQQQPAASSDTSPARVRKMRFISRFLFVENEVYDTRSSRKRQPASEMVDKKSGGSGQESGDQAATG
jgi:hypothetical protein